MKEAAGPTISAFPDIDVDERLSSYNLNGLRPRVIEYSESFKVVRTKNLLPEPKEASSTLPEIIDYSFVIPGVEPTLGFQDFIRGVACASLIILPAYQDAVHAALMTVAERVVETGTLPALSGEFLTGLQRGMQLILSNGEPSGWRGLLAFMQGAYWLLGFVENPTTKRGKNGLSPVEYVDAMVSHFSALGYVPR